MINVGLIISYYYFTTYFIKNKIIDNPHETVTQIISNDPKIIYISNFLSQKEIDHLIDLCEKNKQESKVEIESKNNTAIEIKEEQRTSSTAFLSKGMTLEVINIEKRAAEFAIKNSTNKINESYSYNYIEPMQIVVYKNQEYYKPHMDTFSNNSKDLLYGGNRFATILVYLNTLDDSEKGKTIFPKLNIAVQPRRGDAIYFENMKDGQIDYRLLHEGEPTNSEKKKYIMNIWIREKDYLH
jgi:prolyl 4-hydroxylase